MSRIKLEGYTHRLSVKAGETICFMVGAEGSSGADGVSGAIGPDCRRRAADRERTRHSRSKYSACSHSVTSAMKRSISAPFSRAK